MPSSAVVRSNAAVQSQLPPSVELPGIVQAMRLTREPFEFLTSMRRRYGDTFVLNFPGDPPRVVTGDPAYIHAIFAMAPDHYRMEDQAIPLNVGKGSLLYLDGERHRAQHRLLMPPIHGKNLANFAGLIAAVTHATIDGWRAGEVVTLLDHMQDITLKVICKCVLGAHDGEQIARLREIILQWMSGPMSPTVFTLSMIIGPSRVRRFFDRQVETSPVESPNPEGKQRLLPWQRIGDAKAELMSMLRQELVACRRDGRSSRTDVLAMLAETRDERGEPMAIDDAVDEIITLLVGGLETTANALCWTIHHLLADPDAHARALTELHEANAAGELRRPWLDACVKEALRLKPIAPVVNRALVKPLELGPYTIPGDAIMWPSIYLTQVNENIWDQPERYMPERFVGEHRPRANEWLPFGGGQRRCIGAAFAEYEIRIILSILLERVEFERPANADPAPIMRGITTSPRDGLRLRVARLRHAGT